MCGCGDRGRWRRPARSSIFQAIESASEPQGPITIVLADDHTLVRHGLRLLLDGDQEFAVVAEAADVDEAARKVLAYKPRVLVLDLSMPGGPSLAAIPQAAAPMA